MRANLSKGLAGTGGSPCCSQWIGKSPTKLPVSPSARGAVNLSHYSDKINSPLPSGAAFSAFPLPFLLIST